MAQISHEQRTLLERLYGPDYELLVLTDILSVESQLLQSPPFARGDETKIFDVRMVPPQPHICRDKSTLLRQLAWALCCYQSLQQLAARTPQELQQRTTEAVAHLAFVLRSTSPPATTRRRRRTSQQVAIDLLHQAIRRVTLDDYAQMIKRSIGLDHRRLLYNMLYEAFAAYGPPAQRYPRIARDTMIAHILIHVGIEQGTPEAVVERLRGRARDR